MNNLCPIALLDLCPITEGSNAATALQNSVELAQLAERLGYSRFWLAEHHSMPGIASAATSVVICHVANATKSIRVGAGGIMLPNHAPLVIAEQFGTLESLFPGRIDLGLGRAPGSAQNAARALRKKLDGGDTFLEDLIELRSYFGPSSRIPGVRAVPGENLNIPIWLLGSSDQSAQLAAQFGLPFAFASHFAPDYVDRALQLYRNNFQPSASLSKPHVMIGVNVFASDSKEEAKFLFSSLEQAFLNLIRVRPGQLPKPVRDMKTIYAHGEEAAVARMTKFSLIGDESTINSGLRELHEKYKPDEIIATAMIYDHAARMRSFEILGKFCN